MLHRTLRSTTERSVFPVIQSGQPNQAAPLLVPPMGFCCDLETQKVGKVCSAIGEDLQGQVSVQKSIPACQGVSKITVFLIKAGSRSPVFFFAFKGSCTLHRLRGAPGKHVEALQALSGSHRRKQYWLSWRCMLGMCIELLT